MRGWTLLVACLLLLAPVAAPPAAADGSWYEDLRNRYAHATLTALEDLAKDETRQRLAREPKDWATFSEILWIYSAYVGRTHPEHAQAVFETMRAQAETLAKADGATPHHHLALAWCTMAGCRARRAAEAKPPAEPSWAGAAATLLEHGASSPQLCLQASTSFAEAAAAKGADADALLAKGKEASEKARALVSGSQDKAIIHAGWHADAAYAYLLRKKKGPAKKHVEQGLACLAEGLERSRPTKDIENAHFELAAINARGKLRVKGADVRMQTTNISLAGLEIDLPSGECWDTQPANEGSIFGFHQRILRGPTMRFGYLSAWDQDGRLTFPDGTRVPTSDVKKMAEATSSGFDAHYHLSDIESVSKARKARLHKSLDDVYLVVAEGTMQDSGRWARLHVYHFQSKETKRTYRLTIYEYERDAPEDPVFEQVLESLRVRK